MAWIWSVPALILLWGCRDMGSDWHCADPMVRRLTGGDLEGSAPTWSRNLSINVIAYLENPPRIIPC